MNGKAPYPNIGNLNENPMFARRLIPMMADELQAISEYIYQSIIFEEIMPELSRLLSDIAMTEMHHYRLLGELVDKLGGNPAMRMRISNTPIDISDDTPSIAPVAAKRALNRGLESERGAARKYELLAAEAPDGAKPVLRRIAADETIHAGQINKLLRG